MDIETMATTGSGLVQITCQWLGMLSEDHMGVDIGIEI
jgi:hypothetical protein